MSRILYINPGYKMRTSEGYLDVWYEYFKKILEEAKRDDTEIDVTDLGIKEEVNTLEFPGMLCLSDIFKTVIEAERKGYDAAIIGCASDPGVKEAKRMVSIPVVGPSEAGIYVATLLGKKWSIILPGPFDKRRLIPMYPWMETIGLGNLSFKVVNVYGTPEGEAELMKRLADKPYEARHAILELFGNAMKSEIPKVAKMCVEEDGAEVTLLGCTFWSGWKKEIEAISQELKVLVLNPAVVALKVAENLVDVWKA